MKVLCPKCGNFVVVNGLGRPAAKYPVQNVLNAYQTLQNIGLVAEKLNLSRGTVWRILKSEGVEIVNAKGTK